MLSAGGDGRLSWAEAVWQRDELTPLTLIVGPRGCGHTLVARTLAASVERDLLEVDVEVLPASVDPMVLVREARWLGAAIALRCGVVDRRLMSLVGELLDAQVAVIVSVGEPGEASRVWPTALRVDVERPDCATRRRLWAEALPAWARAEGLDDASLAFRFRGTPREIHALAASAMRESHDPDRRHARVSRSHIDQVARRTLLHRLGQLGAPCAPLSGGLGRVILASGERALLDEIVMRVEQRQTVVETWTRETADHGLGTVVLFSGPPGTGKTLSARAITSELGIPLVVVDLSQVVSKWVGETEKHLDACFAEAEATGVALLFDEADALFSKRSGKGDRASDRHANLEVGFLLQRIEAFTGLCFLTTNLPHAIDAAFQRRIGVHVHFGLPDVEAREALWRLQLGEHLPVDDTIDTAALAEDFEDITGADIRASVLQAAYIAAGTGVTVSQALLVACTSRTLLGRGVLVRSVPHPLEAPAA